jgi:hypothetical protein
MTRLLAEPEPLAVDLTAAGVPVRFIWRGSAHEVDMVANRWRVTSTWWVAGAEAAREYFKVVTTEGLLCIVYRDMAAGGWFMARVYD